jgi:hypothetical protein
MPLVRLAGLAIAKTFSKLFGLATITFFGRVPSKDDDKVGAIGLIAITWYVVLAAIPFPAVGELIFPFLEDEDTIIRGLAVALGITMPLLAGFLVTRMENRSEERDARSIAREMAFGYGYCAIIGGLVILLIAVVPIVKGSYIIRRFDLKHIAVMIDGDSYDTVLEEIREALAEHDLDTEVERPSWPIYRIFTWLAWIEGHIFRREVADEMLLLRGRTDRDEKFEVTLHATDISILGSQHATTMVMAILGEELDERQLYFSWDDESQALEDRVRDTRTALEEDGELPSDDDLREMCDQLRELSLETEEWNSIRRRIFALEAACLRERLARAEARLAEHEDGESDEVRLDEGAEADVTSSGRG